MNRLHPAYGSLASDTIRALREAEDDERRETRAKLDALSLAAWMAAEAAFADGAISEETFENYETWALEEGLTTPRPGGKYVWGRNGLVREEE